MNQEMGELAPAVEALIRLQVRSTTCGGARFVQSVRNLGHGPCRYRPPAYVCLRATGGISAGPCVQSAVPT